MGKRYGFVYFDAVNFATVEFFKEVACGFFEDFAFGEAV
jgi:hypothetical protein